MKVSIDRADLTEMILDYANDRMGLKINPKDISWVIDGKKVDKPNVAAEFTWEADLGEER